MKRLYEILGGEPWCFPPDVIGEMTDWQAWELYIKPALKRNRSAEEDRRDRAFRSKSKDKNEVVSREEYIEVGVRLGGNAEELGRGYDEAMAAWEAKRRGRIDSQRDG